MAATRRTTRQERNARLAATAEPKVNKFALLSETLLLGVCLFVLGLPVVTAPAAYAAELEKQRAARVQPVASPALMRNNSGQTLIHAG